MTTREAVEHSIRKSASLYLDEYWQEGWGDVSREEFESMVSDFTGHVSAAIDDCFHDYSKERTNALRSNRTAVASDGIADSGGNSREPDAQQDVGERRVEFDFAAVADMQQEMERAREGRDA